MIRAAFRILAGFVVAALVAGFVTVTFVITPVELAGLSGSGLNDRLGALGMLSLLAATHSAIFAAPFALLAAIVGEWQSIRNPIYYATTGILIALGGFAAQYSSEAGAAASIANNYALKAFLTAGFFGGLSYWMFAGRAAGDDEELPVTTGRPAAGNKPAANPPAASKSATTAVPTTAPPAGNPPRSAPPATGKPA